MKVRLWHLTNERLLDLAYCQFLSSAFGQTYIIGGYVPQPHSEPHILSLQRGTSNMHFCGATLVSSTHGVSAAHCYYNPAIVTGFG